MRDISFCGIKVVRTLKAVKLIPSGGSVNLHSLYDARNSVESFPRQGTSRLKHFVLSFNVSQFFTIPPRFAETSPAKIEVTHFCLWHPTLASFGVGSERTFACS